MVLGGAFFRRDACARPAGKLYAKAVEQARQPEFYASHGVPDTVDGRFELIALHVFLLLHRLKQDHPASADLAQAVFDLMFLDMDQNLRELGVGDLGVPRRIKDMVQGFYGRIAAYEAGLPEGGGDLEAALRRNLYGTVRPAPASVAAVAAYVHAQVAALSRQDYAALAAGELTFGAATAPDLAR